MTWDEVLVYALGCLALEQSRDITIDRSTRWVLHYHGLQCLQGARASAALRTMLTAPGSYSC